MTELTQEQRAVMEANRLKALERLAAKKNATLSNTVTENRQLPVTIQPPIMQTSQSIPNPFFQKTTAPKPSVPNNQNFIKKPPNPPKAPSSVPASRPRSNGQIHIELHSRTTFSVSDSVALSSTFKSIPGFSYSIKEKKWIFPINEYLNLLPLMREKCPDATFQSIPQNVLSLFLGTSTEAPKKRKRTSLSVLDEIILSPAPKQHENEFSPYHEKLEGFPFDLSLLDTKLRTSLLPFQLAGLRFALEKQGRILLADDMGLGKTIQSLAIASFYKLEWPLLIIVPASLMGSWVESIDEWMGDSVPRHRVNALYAATIQQLLKSSQPLFPESCFIHVLSYDAAVKYGEILKAQKFQVIICDESHSLRNPATKRSKVILPLLKKSARVILLSGTPALSRPIELFTQLMALRPKLFPNMVDYGTRYCAGRKNNFGWDLKGASHTRELSVILEHTVMLRRLKSAVLTQLPAKRRQQIFLTLDAASSTKIKTMMKAIEQEDVSDTSAWQSNAMLMKCWRETGTLKLPAIQEYLKELFAKDDEQRDPLDLPQKYLLFAHHQHVLDGLEDLLWTLKVPFIRIDGQTPVQQRQEHCTLFQDPHSNIRVALLSLTAAGVGLTLTAASIVLFTELFWNPGVLIQAEDRAHRIGQKDSVLVQYLLAKGTTDDTLWPLILRKLSVLESVGLTKNDFGQIEKPHLKEDQKGDQKSILSFLAPTTS